MSGLPEDFFAALQRLKVVETPMILWVAVAEQRLCLFQKRRTVAAYLVSTSKNGTGCRKNSLQTPTGLHRVAQKIGDGQPIGMIFKERRPVGVQGSGFRVQGLDDLIMTRILWLEGLEPGVNRGGEVDTFERHIYIHGTNHGDEIGRPASHGCVRMRNDDVVKLFDVVEVGTLVWIG